MNINIKYFHPEVQKKILTLTNSTENTKKLEALNKSTSESIQAYKLKLKEIEKKISSLKDLLENTKIADGDMGFNLSKKIILETDMDCFVQYITYLSLEGQKEKKNSLDLINTFLFLLDLNTKNDSLNFIEFTSVKITLIYLKLSLETLLDLDCSDALDQIQEEISKIEKLNQNKTNSGFESIESEDSSNFNTLINQIPLLKSYLIHWSMLLFIRESNLGTHNPLHQVDKFLSLICTVDNFKQLEFFDYLNIYVCILFLISKKEKYRKYVLELKGESSAISFISNLYGEFDLDMLLNQRMEILSFVKNDCFMKIYLQEIEFTTSEFIVQNYIKLYSSINLKKIESLKFRQISLKDYVIFTINCHNYSAVIEDLGDKISYKIDHNKYMKDYKLRNRVVENISKTILNHLEG